MVLLVPGSWGGLPKLEEKLTSEKLGSLFGSISRECEDDVEVILPKFELEESIDLKDVLIKNGVKKIFDECEANIRNMSYQPLSVGAAVHKGYYH